MTAIEVRAKQWLATTTHALQPILSSLSKYPELHEVGEIVRRSACTQAVRDIITLIEDLQRQL